MDTSRLESLEKMLADYPEDRRLRYFLGTEYRRAGRAAEAADQLQAYIQGAPESDVGAAWRDLALCYEQLGRRDEARSAYDAGVRSARTHNHSELAGEIQALRDLLPT